MKLNCPEKSCIDLENDQKPTPHGSYYRTSDSKWIKRYRCGNCKRTFSQASFSPAFKQHKRRINPILRRLLASGVSQRRAAIILNVHRITIARKFRFLAREARRSQENFIKSLNKVHHIQFDDLETFEHSKCKPLSVALAVEFKTRKILSYAVSQMPAKGHLSKLAREKYGYRKDERDRGWNSMFASLNGVASETARFDSDMNPHYPRHLRNFFPKAIHQTSESRRSTITAQGELKKVGFDPLFSLNHTCAMFRANINRLFRKTWCTTKDRDRLSDHIAIYVDFHNQELTN